MSAVAYTPLPAAPIISPQQMEEFEEQGAILVDLQLSPELLDAGEAAHDRDASPMCKRVAAHVRAAVSSAAISGTLLLLCSTKT